MVIGAKMILSNQLFDSKLPAVFIKNKANISHKIALIILSGTLIFSISDLTRITDRKNVFSASETNSNM